MAHEHRPQHEHGDLAEILDLEAEVLHDYLRNLVDSLPDLTTPRILDIGSGTGTGTLALLRRYPDAHVTALDISPEMLARLEHHAAVETVRADLDAAWPEIDPVDLAWASNSMHHMADPDHALHEVFARLRPGGVLAVAEMNSFPRFFEDDPAELRAHEAMAAARSEDMPHMGDDWSTSLVKAGFVVEQDRTIDIDLAPPLPPAAGRLASASLRRMSTGLADRLSAADRQQLESLAETPPRRIRASRTFWLARRPMSAR